MRWDCGPDWHEYKTRRESWHPWFAWWPTRVASHDCRWLEWIERRGNYWSLGIEGDGWVWEYRAPYRIDTKGHIG